MMPDDKNPTIQRRTVLKTAGVTTAGLATGTAKVSAEELSGVRRQWAIAKALADENTQSLIDQYDFIGQRHRSDATVTEVSMDESTVQFVEIPYEVNGDSPDTSEIVWNNRDEIPPTAVHVDEDTSGSVEVEAYYPSESGDEQVLKVDIDEDGEKPDDKLGGTATPAQVFAPTGPAGMCGYSQVPNLSCAYDWVRANEEVSRSCSIFVASIATKVVPVIVAGGLWCAWDIAHEGIDPQDCDLCTSDLDEAASGLPIDPSDIPTDPDDYPSRPSWDDLPGSGLIPW